MTTVYLLYFTRLRADKARCCMCPLAAPPSAPRDLSSSALSAEGRLQLSWSPPLVTGGRSDLAYSVVCEQCNGVQCVPCGEKIRFEPGPVDLQETTVVITDLDAHLNYTFTVEAHSGVSQFSTKKATTSLTTALDHTGELRQHDDLRFFFLSFHTHLECLDRLWKTGAYSTQRNLVSPTKSPGIWSHLPWLWLVTEHYFAFHLSPTLRSPQGDVYPSGWSQRHQSDSFLDSVSQTSSPHQSPLRAYVPQKSKPALYAAFVLVSFPTIKAQAVWLR